MGRFFPVRGPFVKALSQMLLEQDTLFVVSTLFETVLLHTNRYWTIVMLDKTWSKSKHA